MRRHDPRRAFTLIELLLVLVILAVLAAVVIPNMLGRGDQAKRSATIASIASLKGAITTFETDNGHLPNTLNDLYDRPQDDQGTWHRLMDKVPADGWGHEFQYRTPSTIDPDHNDFDIISPGHDGQFGTEDDIDQTVTK